MKILIIRFSSLGDIILTTSVLAWLKEKYRNVEIDYATSSEFASLTEGHPLVNKTLLFNRKSKTGLSDLWQFSRKISQEKYDLIIDMHGTTRATLLRYFCFLTPFLVLEKRRFFRFLLVKFKINFLDKKPHLKRVLEDFGELIAFDGRLDKITHLLQRQAKDARPYLSSTPWTFQELEKKQEKIIIFAPVASFAPKRWPIHYFEKLADLILEDPLFEGVKIVSLGGRGDTYCAPLSELEKKTDRFVNLQGKTSLNETASWIKNSSLCIGNDTGLGHIAESFGIASIVLFGPTVKEFGFGPHLKDSMVLQEDVFCRPCSTTGAKPCYRDKQYCMLDLTPEKVFHAVKQKWREIN